MPLSSCSQLAHDAAVRVVAQSAAIQLQTVIAAHKLASHAARHARSKAAVHLPDLGPISVRLTTLPAARRTGGPGPLNHFALELIVQ